MPLLFYLSKQHICMTQIQKGSFDASYPRHPNPLYTVINFTNFSLILSPTETNTHTFSLFRHKWWCPPHYSAPCFSHFIYLGGHILINRLQECLLITSYGQNQHRSTIFIRELKKKSP